MKLGYFMDENLNSLTVRNEFTVEEDTEAMWSFHTMADITIDDDIVYLYNYISACIYARVRSLLW